MSAVAIDLQLDFWTTPELEPAGKRALAAVGSDRTVGGEHTLEDIVLGAWEGLAAHRAVDCPVCGAVMRPDRAGDGAPVSGTCGGCGTQLC